MHVHEPSLGLRGTLVVDNVATGPSIGGLRMAPDVSTEECFRLARAMTLKNAAASLPHGGGKSVLYGDPRMPRERKEPLVRAMTCAALAAEKRDGRSVGFPSADVSESPLPRLPPQASPAFRWGRTGRSLPPEARPACAWAL